jgi:hypothetical protein
MKELPSVLQKIRVERASVSIMAFFRKRLPVLFRRPAILPIAASTHHPGKPAPPRMLCIGRIHRGKMTMVVAFPRKGTEAEGNRIRRDRGDRHHGGVSQGGKVAGKTSYPRIPQAGPGRNR